MGVLENRRPADHETVLLGRVVNLVLLADPARKEAVLTQVIVEALETSVPRDKIHNVSL